MLNREWHRLHRMPEKASEEERLAWHLEHAQHCACRPIPAKLRALMDARGLPPPARQSSED